MSSELRSLNSVWLSGRCLPEALLCAAPRVLQSFAKRSWVRVPSFHTSIHGLHTLTDLIVLWCLFIISQRGLSMTWFLFSFLSSQQRVPGTHQRKRGFAAAVSVRIRDAPRAHLFAVQEPNHELSVLVMRVNFFGIPKENGSLIKPCHGFCPCPKAQAQRTL